jgi:hypothetical protein
MHILIHINRYMNKYLLKKRSFMVRPVSPQKIPSGAISTAPSISDGSIFVCSMPMCRHRLCAYSVIMICRMATQLLSCRIGSWLRYNWIMVSQYWRKLKKELVRVGMQWPHGHRTLNRTVGRNHMASIGPSRYAVAAWPSHAESDRCGVITWLDINSRRSRHQHHHHIDLHRCLNWSESVCNGRMAIAR